MSSLRPLGLALAVLLAAGAAWGDTPWTRYEDNPVLEAGEPGDWDQGGVLSGAVLFDGTTYHMWYAGVRTQWPDADIGYATSTDGVTWTKHPDPVLLREDTWDSGGVFPGAVVRDGTTYHMWYVNTSGSITQTGYATSTDGVIWTPYPGNPVLRVGDPGSWDEVKADIHAVRAEEGTYRAWYNGRAAGSSREQIGHATSTDGVTWTKHPEPVLSAEWPGWDGSSVTNASVVFDGAYHMWYRGGTSVAQIGHAASSDGIRWVRQPADEPVLPTGGAGAWDSGIVDLPQVLLVGDTAKMWYTGALPGLQTIAIGYATAPAPSPDARESFLPAAALAAGAQGAFFVTEVEINNGGTEEAEVVFHWLPRGEDNSEPLASDPIVLAAGQSRRWEDALTELFGLGPDSLGALRLVASTESVIAMSRIYNLPPGETAGTFGQGLPAIRATEMIPTGVTKRIIFLSEDDDFRANLGCVNGIDAGVAVAIELHDSEGVALETKHMLLPPYSNLQINGIFQGYAPINGYVEVHSNTPAAWIYCYGSVLDNLTSDPTTVLPQ